MISILDKPFSICEAFLIHAVLANFPTDANSISRPRASTHPGVKNYLCGFAILSASEGCSSTARLPFPNNDWEAMSFAVEPHDWWHARYSLLRNKRREP